MGFGEPPKTWQRGGALTLRGKGACGLGAWCPRGIPGALADMLWCPDERGDQGFLPINPGRDSWMSTAKNKRGCRGYPRACSNVQVADLNTVLDENNFADGGSGYHNGD